MRWLAVPAAASQMQVFVTRARDGRVMTFEVEGDWTVAQLKDAVAAHEYGAPVERQRVFLNAMELLGARKLAEYGVKKEAEMKLIEREAMPHADEQGSTTVELAKIAGMGDGLAAGWAELSEDKRRLAEAKQALAQANMPEDGKLRKKLKLNVGGTLFKNVKRETLCVVPESNLAKLLSGRWERSLLRDKDGNPFLDLPNECFGEIMTFLGDRKLRPGDPIALPAVPEEQEPTISAGSRSARLLGYRARVPWNFPSPLSLLALGFLPSVLTFSLVLVTSICIAFISDANGSFSLAFSALEPGILIW